MTDLQRQNYNAIVARGFINRETKELDFVLKFLEERKELCGAFNAWQQSKSDSQKHNLSTEIADCINVLQNWLIFMEYDPEQVMKECLERQLKRIESKK